MISSNPLPDVFIFSRKPLVTEPMIRLLLLRLTQKDDMAKEPMIDFIRHRLDRRYIQPLLDVSGGYKSGFLMMAVSCLLIEALESFYKGLNSTKGKGISQKAFLDFFDREKECFPGFEECFPIKEEVNDKGKKFKVCSFYKNI